VFDIVTKVLSLCVSYLITRENAGMMVMVVPFVIIGYIGSLGGLYTGVRAVRELQHAGIIRQ
jgi:energy-coupling factor transport system substrate-specific component